MELCICGHDEESHHPKDADGKEMGYGCCVFIGADGLEPPICGCTEFTLPEPDPVAQMRANNATPLFEL